MDLPSTLTLPPLSSRSIFIAGPTAVGKSAVAPLLAENLAGEIISVDSIQVYRGLDIGAAKPSLAERQRVRHHLIDVAALTESFDAARFAALAAGAVREIIARGRTPIFCGGTGFYFKAFLDGLGEAPPADPGLRRELEATDLAELLRELALRDPATYERIDRRNPRRIIRAMEVIRLTGRPFSEQKADWGKSRESVRENSAGPRCIVLNRSVEDLRRRIDSRVDEMFSRGLVAETERLLEEGLASNPTAMQAIGYRQVVGHLQGQRSLDETIQLVKQRTRQFAKRQLTWFRRQMSATWLACEPDETADSIAARVLALNSVPSD